MWPPSSGNFLFALTTIAAAFHLIKDLILLSIFWSPWDLVSLSGDIVFTYGVFLESTKSEPCLYECSISCLIKNWALLLPSVSKTEDNESIHSFVSIGSISPSLTTFEIRSSAIFIVSFCICGWEISFISFWISVSWTCFISLWIVFSASSIKFFVLFGISSGDTFPFPSTSKIKSPLETLSPTLTLIFDILPSTVDGTSTLDLSLSSVTTGSFFFILSPAFTMTSIISTCSKSPISGTFNWIDMFNFTTF